MLGCKDLPWYFIFRTRIAKFLSLPAFVVPSPPRWIRHSLGHARRKIWACAAQDMVKLTKLTAAALLTQAALGCMLPVV
jgi:hypothetical protein